MRILQLVLLAAAFGPASAIAAQWARVTVDSIEVYDGPTKSHRVQRKIKRGVVLQASNYPTEGFYKVRLQDGTLGWVSGSALLLKGPALENAEKAGKAKGSGGVESHSAQPPEPEDLPPPLPE